MLVSVGVLVGVLVLVFVGVFVGVIVAVFVGVGVVALSYEPPPPVKLSAVDIGVGVLVATM